MKDSCPFLRLRGPAGDKCCAAGVNFSSVRPDRALRRFSQLSDLGEVPVCMNAEVCAFVVQSGSGVAARAESTCPADYIPDDLGRHACPGRFPRRASQKSSASPSGSAMEHKEAPTFELQSRRAAVQVCSLDNMAAM